MWRRCSPSGAWTSPTARSAVLRTIRRWFLKFGSAIAANLRRTRPRPSDHWHLDEMVIVIQRKRDPKVAKKLMKKLLKKHGFAPSRIVTGAVSLMRTSLQNTRSRDAQAAS